MKFILLVIHCFSKLCFKIIFYIFLILNLFSEMIATFPELSLHKSDEYLYSLTYTVNDNIKKYGVYWKHAEI